MTDREKDIILDLEKKIESMTLDLDKTKNESNNNWDLFLRAKAEMENLRKRSIKEVNNSIKYANKKIIYDLLPLLDAFDSYFFESNKDFENNIKSENIILFYKLFLNILEKHGLKKIEVLNNEKFDPSKHEAISVVYDDLNDDVISSVVQSGYMLHDHVLRYVKVSVFRKKDK